MAYYHLTTPEAAKIIMKEGLKPMLGERSKSIKEENPALYLCTKASLDAWAIMLGLNTAVKVTIPNKKKLEVISKAPNSDEYRYDGAIPAKCITDILTVTPSESVLKQLRKDYIAALSQFCVLCARYYTEGTGWKDGGELQAEIEENIEYYGTGLLPVIPRLNYAEMDRKEIRDMLHILGDSGAYTFCDDYDIDIGEKPIKRLYQMLIEYPDDKFTDIRKAIYKLIKTNFKYCLRTNTGGWTG